VGLRKPIVRCFTPRQHIDGIDRDPALYWDWEHFNGIGATKMSQLLAPLIAALANSQRPEPAYSNRCLTKKQVPHATLE
jgi:hypothetical protein